MTRQPHMSHRVDNNEPGATPIPAEVRRDRIQRLVDAACAADLAALVIFSHGSRSGIGTHGNLRYLLDWTSWGAPTMLVLPTDREPTVAVPGPYDVPWMGELCPWLSDVRLEVPGNHGRLARAILTEKGIRGPVGLIGANEREHAVYSDLIAPDNRWTFRSVDELLHGQRVVKDEFGLARMRRAAAICDAMFASLAEALHTPRLPAWKAQAILDATALMEGAETTRNWIVAGKRPDRTRGRREENLAPIEIGDCVVAAIIMTYAGYYGHTLRMFSIGEPTEEHIRVWSVVHDAQNAAAALLRPGANARLVPPAAEDVLFDHFPDAREGDRLRFQVSHFIGLDYAEYPTAVTSRPPSHGRSRANTRMMPIDYPLEEGMTMEIHPNLRPPGLGLGAVGDIFVVGPDGGERLTKFPTTLQTITPR
jgi:Xaa-Pro aminopeptidase